MRTTVDQTGENIIATIFRTFAIVIYSMLMRNQKGLSRVLQPREQTEEELEPQLKVEQAEGEQAKTVYTPSSACYSPKTM